MVLISKSLGAEKLKDYHRSEYANPQRAYYTEGQELQGFWHGRLASEIGLVGHVSDVAFDRLTEGKDPHSGDQLIRWRTGKVVADGKEREHRAGWDFMFAPGKSVSVTALVGGDDRIRVAHRLAVREAADFGERYTQAKLGGNRGAMTTGKWIAAGFEHDTSRPVDGYPAPQLHTHLVVFNLTALDGNGKSRSIESQEWHNLQNTLTRIYQNRLSHELQKLGYEIEHGKNQAPEIKGYSREYLEAESQRRQHIQGQMEKLGLSSRRASDIIAMQSRDEKMTLRSEELLILHRAQAAVYGNQHERVIEGAKGRERNGIAVPEMSVRQAVDFALRKLSERHAVIERDGFKQTGGIIQTALEYGQGRVSLPAIEKEVERRKHLTESDRAKGLTVPELSVTAHYRTGAPGERYATRDMLAAESRVIRDVLNSQGQYAPIASAISKDDFREKYRSQLTDHQMHMVWNVLQGTDQIFGVNGSAGSGKSRSMKLVAQIARDHGYTVRGLTPTSTACKELEAAGIESITLAKHNLSVKREAKAGTTESGARLYIVDEASLAGTKVVEKFLATVRPQDRVVMVGDRTQHSSIDAGRLFHQLQIAGMATISLSKIMRQKENPELLKAVQLFQRGETREAVHQLLSIGAIKELPDRVRRFEDLARRFAESPTNSIALSPDNQSRSDINQAIRAELKRLGLLGEKEVTVSTLVTRNDLYQHDTTRADRYEVSNWVKAGRKDAALQIGRGEYLEVIAVSASDNTITVRRTPGELLTFDPEKHDLNSSVYKNETRGFSVGDSVQWTAQWKEKGVVNRERGVVEELDERGNATVRLDAKEGQHGRVLKFNLRDSPHLDYGYSMTSFSSQSITVERVFMHADNGDIRAKTLLDKVAAYVMASRASHELYLYTDSAADLETTLGRYILKPTALSREQTEAYRLERRD